VKRLPGIFLGIKAAGVTKFVSLNFSEPSGPVQACYGTAFELKITPRPHCSKFYRKFKRRNARLCECRVWVFRKVKEEIEIEVV